MIQKIHDFLFPKCEVEQLKKQLVLLRESDELKDGKINKLKFQVDSKNEVIKDLEKKYENKCLVIPVLVGEKASTLNVLIPKCKYSELLEDIYHVPRLEDVKAFLEWSKINKEKWVAQENDCDDQSRRLWVEAKNWWPLVSFGFCTLTLKTYRHAANWFIAYDGGKMGIWFCEPSDDSVWKGKYPGTLSNDLLMM